MNVLQSSCHTGTRISSSIHTVSSVVVFRRIQQCLDSGLYKGPCTRVQWLFLAPYNCLGVRIRVEVLLQLLPREGVELFDTSDSSILETLGLTVLV